MTIEQPYVWSDDNNNLVEYCEPVRVETSPGGSGSTPTTSKPTETPTKLVKTRERRQVERKIVYPYFLDYVMYTSDPYWQQVLDDCAKSKFPRGSSYDAVNRTICIRSTKTPVFYKVRTVDELLAVVTTNDSAGNGKDSDSESSSDTEFDEFMGISPSLSQQKTPASSLEDQSEAVKRATFEEIKQFFQTYLNLSSSEDQRQMNAIHDDLKGKTDERYSKAWSDINLKKVRSTIIRDYIITQGALHGLSLVEKIESYKIVKIGLLFGWIEKSHIVYKDRQIVEIKSLKYNPSKRRFEIDGVDTEDVSASIVKYKPKIQRMDALWEKSSKTAAKNKEAVAQEAVDTN